MTPQDFIKKNIRECLEKEGVTPKIAHTCALSAIKHYRNLGNQGGKMFDVLLKEARQQAKRLEKAGL